MQTYAKMAIITLLYQSQNLADCEQVVYGSVLCTWLALNGYNYQKKLVHGRFFNNSYKEVANFLREQK